MGYSLKISLPFDLLTHFEDIVSEIILNQKKYMFNAVKKNEKQEQGHK